MDQVIQPAILTWLRCRRGTASDDEVHAWLLEEEIELDAGIVLDWPDDQWRRPVSLRLTCGSSERQGVSFATQQRHNYFSFISN